MNERDLSHLEVGDAITVVTPSYSRHAERKVEESKVVKVGRTLLYVQVRDWGEPTAFYRADGRERVPANGNSSYASSAFTAEGWATKKRRDEIEEELFERVDKRAVRGWKRDLSIDQLERILAVLDEATADSSFENESE